LYRLLWDMLVATKFTDHKTLLGTTVNEAERTKALRGPLHQERVVKITLYLQYGCLSDWQKPVEAAFAKGLSFYSCNTLKPLRSAQ